MTWLASLFSWLLSRLFGKTPALSQEARQADRAAVAETKLSEANSSLRTEAAIAQAVTSAPKDTAGVIDALDKGTF